MFASVTPSWAGIGARSDRVIQALTVWAMVCGTARVAGQTARLRPPASSAPVVLALPQVAAGFLPLLTALRLSSLLRLLATCGPVGPRAPPSASLAGSLPSNVRSAASRHPSRADSGRHAPVLADESTERSTLSCSCSSTAASPGRSSGLREQCSGRASASHHTTVSYRHVFLRHLRNYLLQEGVNTDHYSLHQWQFGTAHCHVRTAW